LKGNVISESDLNQFLDVAVIKRVSLVSSKKKRKEFLWVVQGVLVRFVG